MRDAIAIAFILITAGVYYLLRRDVVGAFSLAIVFLGAYAVSLRPGVGAPLLYAFIGFFAGFVVAIIIGVETNATGWKAAILWTLPFSGAFIAISEGKRDNYRLWWSLKP
ncbi:hypothetical protein [Thermococcus sp.]|uniref:hypothetical protein n=1 Tax=Thermococcus sp. TaxID=35749 RepID=UPI0026182BF4|nr:hypothetical protein [Thermococcus sp.]